MKIKSVLFIFIWRVFASQNSPVFTVSFSLQILRSALFRTDFRRNVFAFLLKSALKKMGPSGLEPPTSRLSGVRSNRLSYGPTFWWRWGESNPWPPACKAGALPAELHPHVLQGFRLVFHFQVTFPVPSKLNNAITSVSTACPSESFLNLNWSFEYLLC